MKRIFFLVLAAAMMLMLASCGERSKNVKQVPVGDNGSAALNSSAPDENADVSTSFEETNGSSDESAVSSDQTVPSTAEPEATEPEVSQTSESTSVPAPSSTSSSISTAKPQQTTAALQDTARQPGSGSSTNAHQHQYTKKKVAATCGSEGYTLYVCSCGDQYTNHWVAPLSHDYAQTVVGVTCTTDGYTLYTCRRCNDQYQSDYIYTYGHSWGTRTVIKEPTVDSEGEERIECSICKETESYAIPKCEYMTDCASEVVKLVNEERAKEGLDPLTPVMELNEYAMLRSTELVDKFEHERLDGSNPLNYVMEMEGIYCAGENIAMGQSSPEAVMNAWMNSPGHHANILESSFTSIGVGCYQYRGRLYWTQIFAGDW